MPTPEPEIDVVIPTRGRADRLEALLDNLRESTNRAQPLLVVDPDDDLTWDVLERCWVEHEGWVRALEFAGGYPQKANAGFKVTSAPLVMIGGDDVRFHPNWLEAALAQFADERVQLVAPNDLSPMAGQNATFPILRRSYVLERGAAWNERGTVYHAGYRHNFSDTECWELAQQRGVGAYAEGCWVEHLHPVWGKAEIDATYRSGGMNDQGWAHDEALYTARHQQWSQG